MVAACGQPPTMDEVQPFISLDRSKSRSHRPWLPDTLLRFVTFGFHQRMESAQACDREDSGARNPFYKEEPWNRFRYSNKNIKMRLAMRNSFYRPQWMIVLTSVLVAGISVASGETVPAFFAEQHPALAGQTLSA